VTSAQAAAPGAAALPARGGGAILEVDGLVKRFGGILAVN
jgi:hypothetical protein